MEQGRRHRAQGAFQEEDFGGIHCTHAEAFGRVDQTKGALTRVANWPSEKVLPTACSEDSPGALAELNDVRVNRALAKTVSDES